ncbi:MAG: cellulose biosynthesis cyclic di-GMP-binding regulatory protein BcsB [Alphaproteobacteria bacterium]|nr:cellulose biosynthesis cyclic di-GMP-binding regulatory protein BcsB [Alphaproteobacteria bacterium]MBU2143500.1 cellulose biosynthesis cyclic di-GMP-binding regulatory protein BcsB [Alphaproteobacteria bacterium]MBU2196147.1 cellulose biosynthesis cyclic di-GMP-binding regulatory protein BcsB [Alphaproteobacteria bacterium]
MITFIRSTALAAILAVAPLAVPAQAQQAQSEDAVYDVYARFRDDPQVAVERLENGLWRARLPLAALRPEQGAIRLDGAKASENISFAVAPQADVQSARVVMRHVSGRAQEDTRPQLRLGLNGRFVAQLDGVTERAAAVNEILLDPDSVMSGFNTLRIDAVQRYTYGCQDPAAAELWTDIDTSRSYVEITYARRPFAGSLADLDALVTAGVGGVENLGILVADGEMTQETLRWGTLASQAVANRLAYRLPEITRIHAGDLGDAAIGTDLIAIGTPDQLSGIAPSGLADLQGDESWLSISPSPADPSRFLIVAAGRTPAAIEGAVRALGAASFPLSDTGSVILSAAETPAGSIMAKKHPLRPGTKYAFRDLGLVETSLLGQERGEIGLDFTLPADAQFRSKGEVEFSLDFAYGAGLDPSSVVNILVNGEFQRAIRLTNADGEVMPGYQLAISPAALHPGQNHVAFEVELSTPSQGECASRNLRHLAFVMKDSSTLTLPAADSFVELPNLALLAESGFPYSGIEGTPFAIRAGDKGDDTAAAVWTMGARLGQVYGTVFTDSDFGFGLALPDAHTLVVGTRAALKGFLPAEVSLTGQSTALATRGSDEPQAIITRDYKSIDLGDNGLLVEGLSPEHAGRLVTVVTAESPAQLIASTRSLVRPSHWSQLKGGAAVWRDSAATVVTQTPAATFEIGQMRPAEMARMKSGRSPLRWIITLGAVLFALAAILAFIARYMRDRMNEK